MSSTLADATVAVAVAAAAILSIAGCSGTAQNEAPPPLVIDSATPTTTTPAAEPGRLPETGGYRLTITKIAASSTLVPLGLNPDKTVKVPPLSEPQQAGVYANGPTPGDPGPAVILGHINSNGRPGIFARLSDLDAGDQVDIHRPDGRTATFTVYRTTTVDKNAFPTSAVYSDTPGPELRLITCGGDLNRAAHSYLSNVIVFGALTRLQ